jgi:hypothetical protein
MSIAGWDICLKPSSAPMQDYRLQWQASRQIRLQTGYEITLRQQHQPTHLLPYDPMQKKRTSGTGGKRDYAEISDTHGTEADVSALGAKKGIGKTGVHLRYHSPPEYAQLTKEEKDELREWRLPSGTKGSKGKSSPKSGKEFKKPHVRFDQTKAIASAVEKKVAERMNAINQSKTKEDELEAYIMSIIKRHSGVKVDGSAADTSEVVKPPLLPSGLKGIIRRAKNGPP